MTEHPDESRWEAFALGELDAAARKALLAHADGCALCDKTRRALADLAEGARFFDAGAPRPRQRAPWAVAGALAVVAAAMLLFLRPAVPPGDTLRSGAGPGEIALADGADFSWAPVAGATEYLVRIHREDGEPVWSGRVKRPAVDRVPSLPAGVYRWEVEALAGTTSLARSRLARFEVR